MKFRPARILSPLATDLINTVQGGFPLHEKPFQVLADKLDCRPEQIIDTLHKLLHDRWLTRFGPLYDAAALGGGLTLAAVCVDEAHYDAVAELINAHPEVAHNYRREHELNMWFVIATESAVQVAATIDEIQRETDLRVFDFPKQREFYVGLWLQIEDGHISTVPVPVPDHTASTGFDEHAVDRKLIRQTQAGIPLTATPWCDIARALGVDPGFVLERMQHMLDAGIIRRIGVVPNHYKMGLRANGMTVWDVADEDVERVGDIIGQLDFVSHCYQRPRHLPEWRYNLFAMVHGHDHDEVDDKVAMIARTLGDTCIAHDVLYSSRILKKTGLRIAA